MESYCVCSGPRPSGTCTCRASFMPITGMPYGSFDSNLPALMAAWIFSKPATTMNLPSGVTSTPCGDFGSGTRKRMPSLIAVSIMMTLWPLIFFALPALTTSAAFFQLITCR